MGIRPALAAGWAPWVRKALQLCQCNTRMRVAAWLAQVGHESGRLRYTRELWGPTAQQDRYESGTSLARKLGNVEPGDGARYLGRGLIQVTGRANYRMCAERMAGLLQGVQVPDFEDQPELLERPEWAALSAATFWHTNHLNRFADAGDFVRLTRAVNGGLSGLAERQHLYIAALGVIHD